MIDHAVTSPLALVCPPRSSADFIDCDALVSEFGLGAEQTEIISGDQVEIQATLEVKLKRIVDRSGVVGTLEEGRIDINIFRPQHAAFDPDIGLVVARERWRGHGRGGERRQH